MKADINPNVIAFMGCIVELAFVGCIVELAFVGCNRNGKLFLREPLMDGTGPAPPCDGG